jgi:hypothetical protein
MNSFCDSHSWVGWFLSLDRGSIRESPLCWCRWLESGGWSTPHFIAPKSVCAANEAYCTTAYNSLQQLTTAYNSLQQLTTAYNSLQQLTTAYNSLQQHTTAFNSIQQRAPADASRRQQRTAENSQHSQTSCLIYSYSVECMSKQQSLQASM